MADRATARRSGKGAVAAPTGPVATATAGIRTRASRLDRLINPETQQAWLISPPVAPDMDERRPKDPAQRERLRHGYQRLRGDALYGDLVDGLRRYIAWTIPFPRRTERRYWVISATPSTNRSNFPRWCAVSVNVMETLVVSRPLAHAGRLAVRMSVDMDTAVAAWGSLESMARSLPDLLVEESYSTARPGVLAIEADHISALPRVLRLPGITQAARTLNLALMRSGPVPHSHGHCFDLADDLLEAVIGEPAEAVPPPAG